MPRLAEMTRKGYKQIVSTYLINKVRTMMDLYDALMDGAETDTGKICTLRELIQRAYCVGQYQSLGNYPR